MNKLPLGWLVVDKLTVVPHRLCCASGGCKFCLIDGTFTCAGLFSSAAGMGFAGTRGDGFTETDLWEGIKTCVGAVLGL